MVHGKPLFWD